MHTDDMNDLFHRATHDIDVDVASVVDGSALRGRRLRRRRTVTTAIGGLAVAAVVAPLAWVGAGALDDSSSPADDTAVAAAPESARIPAFDDAETALQLEAALAEYAPDVTVTGTTPGHFNDRRISDASVTLQSAEGEASIEFMIWPLLEDGTPESVLAAHCDNPMAEPGYPTAVCTPVDGGTLAVTRSSVTQAELAALPADERRGSTPSSGLSVQFITDDGFSVQALAALTLPGSTATELPTPAPGEDALAALVQDARWLAHAPEDDLGDDWVQPTLGSLSVTDSAEATALLKELILEAHPHLSVTESSMPATAGVVRAAVVADDGNGPSYIHLEATNPEPDFDFRDMLLNSLPCEEGCEETEKFQRIARDNINPAPDRVVGSWNSGGITHVDGVSISVNSGDTDVLWVEATKNTRTTPLLSGEQLAEIASSERWVK